MNNILLVVVFLLKICFSADSKSDLECGRPLGSSFITQSSRIVSGYDVGYYRYPWYAALMRHKQVECGGALIGPRLVVTAAHCFKDELQSSNNTTGIKLEQIYTVRLGMYNVCRTENTTVDFQVEKVQVHELYLSKQPYFDICLLTLANSTKGFDPICLPSGVVNPRPRDGTVPGMGTLKYEGPMPCTLHEARLLIYSDSACVKMMNDAGNNGSAIVNAFCAGYLTGGIDTCQGDSGGPFQILDSQGRYTILGLVSFGYHCAVPNYLGVYTDVSRYIKWIKEKSGLDDLDFLQSLGNSSSEESSSHENEINDTNVSDNKKNKSHSNGHSHNRPITIIILRNGKSARQPIRKGKHARHRKHN